MRSVQVVEHIRDYGWLRFFRDIVFFDRKSIVVEKDLDEVTFDADLFRRLNVEFLEVNPELIAAGKYRYAVRNRYYKSLEYMKKGYGAHAIAKDRKIIGDIWYYPAAPSDHAMEHDDLSWLGITLGRGGVYSFDIYLDGKARGDNLSAALQCRSMVALQRLGFKKAYAYYWSDNTPAIWNTRVINKWKEKKVLTVKSIFLRRKVTGEMALPLPRERRI
jgi:hypothetical protein